MSQNLLNKYVWLVETIYNAKYISFEEINRRWLDDDISEGLEIPKRTFHTWIHEVEEMFGLVIQCQRVGGYLYYIENAEEIKKGGLRNWLLHTISTSNLLMENRQLKDRILLEEVPSVKDHLSPILAAMKADATLRITYQSYWRDGSSTFELEPYCVKLFKQRWYLVGRSPHYDQIRIYALDRILSLETKEKKFKMPKKFDPAAFFEDFYGIIAHENAKVETVRLKVSAEQSNYLRSLPLHPSQKEVEKGEGYSIFELRLCPEFDFQQEILSQTPEIEVLFPEWLREEIAEKVCVLWEKYQQRER
jgi:hypothetical protein